MTQAHHVNLLQSRIVVSTALLAWLSPLERGSLEGDTPVSFASGAVVVESSCLGLQLKAGGKFHQKLNTGGRPIAYKYREGKMQRSAKALLKST